MYNIIYSILKYILAVIVLKQLTKETYKIKTEYGRMEVHNLLQFTSWVGASLASLQTTIKRAS